MIELSVSLTSNGVVKVPGYEQLVRFGYTKNRGVYRLHVDATGEWAGLAIRAFWHVPDGKDPASLLVTDGFVDVPASVTAQPGSGCVTFEGSDGTKTVTSADLRYRVSANSGTEDGTEPEPGTSAWQQLVDAVHADATAAEQAKTDAQTAAQQSEASAKKSGKALSDTITAKEDALKAIGDKQTAATQAVDTARDKALQQVDASTEAAQTAASEAATSAGNASQSAQKAAGSLQELKDSIANGDFKGEPGNDGKSPVVTVTDIENGHRVSITDKDGTKTIDVLNGQTGKTGATPVLTIGTVSSGDKPSADITGTPENPVLNLRLQPGPQGPAVALDTTLTHEGEAADAKATGDAIRAETTRAKGAENQLKEDLGELNKVSEKILSVSIIQKCEVADGYYWNFIAGGKETKEISENYIAVKIPVKSNKLIVYGEFQDWASRYVNNGAYTPVESTYISHNTQTSKVAEFYNIPTDAKYLCLSFYKGGLDTSIESINVVSGEFRQNLSYRKTNFVDRLEVYTKDEVDDKLGEIHINKIYVATTGSDTEGNGTKEKPYATVLKANDVVADASEKNKYEIIVADGTYTDLQEKYKGQNGSDYQGVIAKSYVTYKSQSNNPEKCIFIWDGGVGYDTISNDTCANKCFFHINSVTIDTVIKGFKFVGSNLRYCLHFESNCLTTPYIENCIFDWHGRDFLPKNGPVIGMGGCIFSHITFKDCKFLNSQNDAGIQWHDNTYPYDWMNGRYEPEGLCPKGAVIECIDCLFDNLNIQVRSQNEDRPMPCCLILKNCGGLKNVYPSIIAGGTKNYWKLFNQCSFIENDLLTDATETTTYDEMTSIKASTD